MSLENVQITLDLPTLGELTGAIIYDLAERKGIELDEDDLVESCRTAWLAVVRMYDRADFARKSMADIASLQTVPEP